MGAKVLEAIKEKKDAIPEVGLAIIGGDVQNILKNYNEIKGRKFGRRQIYRLAGRDEESSRPGLLQHMFETYCATSFASKLKGELLLGEIDSWRDWRHQFAPPEYIGEPLGGFWNVAEGLSADLSELRLAFVGGEYIGIKVVLAKIKQKAGLLQFLNEVVLSANADEFRAGTSARTGGR